MDKKILLQNLADALAERTGVTKRKAEAFVRSFFEVTEMGLTNDGIVKVKNFGTTKIVNVSDRESVNINTGERFQIEGHAKITFTPDPPFRDLVNRPFAHFTTIVLDDDADISIPEEAPEVEEATVEEAPVVEETVEETPAAEETMEETPAAKETAEEVPPAEETVEEVPIVEEVVEEEEKEVEVEEEEVEEDDAITSETITHTAKIDGKKSNIIIHNTIPEPRHNWWRTAFLILAMVIVALTSYFAGYFRVFCPCSFFGSDAEVVTATDTTPAKIAATDSIAKAQADSVAKAKADSIAKAKADSAALVQAAAERAAEKAAQKAAEKTAQQLAAQKAAAEKATRKLAAQQAAAEKASRREAELECAANYPQIPGANYAITGVLKTRQVRPGENLYMIAKATYGNKAFARYISFYNNIEDPNLVTVGQRLKLPRLTRR